MFARYALTSRTGESEWGEMRNSRGSRVGGFVVAAGIGMAATAAQGVAAADPDRSESPSAGGSSTASSPHAGPKAKPSHGSSGRRKAQSGKPAQIVPTRGSDVATSDPARPAAIPALGGGTDAVNGAAAATVPARIVSVAAPPAPARNVTSPAGERAASAVVVAAGEGVAEPMLVAPAASAAVAHPQNLISGLLAPFGLGGGTPSAPVDSPTLWTVLAWSRRQIVGAFINHAPIAHPVQTSVSEGGVIRGTIGAIDPDGDPMTYIVGPQPGSGTVTIDKNGGYTFTPSDPAFTGAATFTVTVRDEGFRVFSQPGVTTVDVTVRIGAPVDVVTAPTASTPDATTGQVTGSLGVKDPNNPGAGYTFTVVNKSRYGTVTFGADGGYIYTPTLVGRITAALNPGLTDSFTVGVGTTVSEAVDVTVDGIAVSPHAVTTTVNQVGTDSYPFGIAVSKDGSRAYVTNINDGTVSSIDLRTGQVGAVITIGGQPTAIAINGAGNRVYVLDDAADTVWVINTATGKIVGQTIKVGNDATAIVLNANGTRAYVSNSGDDTVSVIDTAAHRVVSTIAVGENPFGMAVSPDGRYVYVTNADSGTVSVISTTRNAVVGTATVGTAPTAIVVSADGSRLYVANSGNSTISDDGTLSVIDTSTLTAIGSPIRVGDYPTGLALSGDGTQLYVADALSSEISLIDTKTFQVVDLPVASGPTGVAAVNSASGPVIVITHTDLLGTGTAPITVISLDGQAGLLTPATGSSAAGTTLSVAHSVADAPTYTPPRGNDWTQGFDVTNLSAYPIILQSQTYDGRGAGPVNGTVLLPGESQHFEVTRYFWSSNAGTLTYRQPDTGQTYVVSLGVSPVFFSELSDETSCQKGNCIGTGSGETTVGLLGVSGSSITIPAQRAEDQAAAVNALCDKSGVTCSFTIKTMDDKAFSAPREAADPVANNSGSVVTTTVTASTTQTVTSSWELSPKIGFKVTKLASLEISGKYGGSTAEAKTFSQALQATIRPGYQGRIMVQTPVTRYYGDMTIIVGDTTIKLTDAYFDAPRDGRARWNVVEEPLPTTTV